MPQEPGAVQGEFTAGRQDAPGHPDRQFRQSQDGLAPGTGVPGSPGLLRITVTMLALTVFFSLHVCFILPQEAVRLWI